VVQLGNPGYSVGPIPMVAEVDGSGGLRARLIIDNRALARTPDYV